MSIPSIVSRFTGHAVPYVAVCCFALFAAADAKAATKPHIVVIVVDDMGYGDPGCYNADSKIPTPHIDSLAAAGMRFTDAHAPGPLCHMSRYGLMTGRYPFRTNVGRWNRHALIEPQQATIASLARQNGYQTAMVGKWHLGFDENGYENPLPGGPVDRGFDTFFGIRASTDIPPYFYIRDNRAVAAPTETIEANRSDGWSPIQGEFWRAGGIAPNLKLKDVLPRFTDEAIQVIQKHDEPKPLMLYLAYPAPHTPWLPSESFREKSGAGMYGDFLMMVDAEIGRAMAALQQAQMDRDTLVIFTSDNGPVWYDRDVERFQHDSVGGLRGMKADAWEGGHRMPFIVRWPAGVSAGAQSDRLVCFTDLMATFAELWGAPLPKGAGPDSFSFLSALRQTQTPQAFPRRDHIVMQAGNSRVRMIRHNEWKLINSPKSGGFSKPKPGRKKALPKGQLYNLADDLAETRNLYEDHPERVRKLTEMMQAVVEADGYTAAKTASKADVEDK